MPIVLLTIVAFIWTWNYFGLQTPMNEVIKGDVRNDGVEVIVTYGNYFNSTL